MLSPQWQEYLKELGLENNMYATILAKCLRKRYHKAWFVTAVTALELNAQHGGEVWENWLTHGKLSLTEVVHAMEALYRHTQTNYDALLAQGVDRVEAREMVKRHMEASGGIPSFHPATFSYKHIPESVIEQHLTVDSQTMRDLLAMYYSLRDMSDHFDRMALLFGAIRVAFDGDAYARQAAAPDIDAMAEELDHCRMSFKQLRQELQHWQGVAQALSKDIREIREQRSA